MAQDDLSTPARLPSPLRVVAITGTQAGLGKTSVTANLAVSLAMQGRHVCVIEAATGAGNINNMLYTRPKYNLNHLLDGERKLTDIITEGPHGIHILTIEPSTDLNAQPRERLPHLVTAFQTIEEEYDYLLIDTAATHNQQTLHFIQAARFSIIIITPEPASLTAAGTLLKTLQDNNYPWPVHILTNLVRSYAASTELFKQFESVINGKITMPVRYLGYIPEDDELRQAADNRQTVLLSDPATPASRSFITIAHAMHRQLQVSADEYTFAGYWSDLWFPAEPAQTAGKAEQNTATPEPEATAPVESPQEETMEIELTTDADAEAHADPSRPLSAEQLLKQLSTTPLSRKQTLQLCQHLVTTSLQQFGKLPFEINEMVYRALELKDFAEADIRHLVRALRALYQKRHNKPLDDPEQAIIEEFSRLGDKQDKMQMVLEQLQQLYQAQRKPEQNSSPTLNLPTGFSGIHTGRNED
ncbi:MAG: AAA family ATPase [Gammaproteobacteria bacterium]|nr:AAA family ATPase [Gammaproteobacteria bacterium]MDH5650266.1 AAA family ATPase [Gammaproteobacteria bacterium]